MSKRYFIRVFSMDEEEGVKPVLNRKLKTRVGNLEELAKELNRTDFYEALGVEEGFDDGISDYIEANKENQEGTAATTAGWDKND